MTQVFDDHVYHNCTWVARRFRQQGAVRLPRARDWPLTAEDCKGMLMSWRCEAAAPEPAAGYDACNTGAVRRKKDDMKRLIADGSRGGRMEAG